MWSSPDIKDHVKETSDFRIKNFTKYLKFKTNTQTVGEYEHVNVGDYLNLIVPDVSSTTVLIQKLSELLDSSTSYEFIPAADYQTPNIAAFRYDNTTLFPILLFLNNVMSNADFTSDKLTNVNIINKNKLRDIIMDVTELNEHTIKEVQSQEEFDELESKCIETANETDIGIEEWLNIKVTNHNFTGVQDTPLYQKLVDEYGEKTIKTLITKLTKYRKQKGMVTSV